jgi:hypothetical protein
MPASNYQMPVGEIIEIKIGVKHIGSFQKENGLQGSFFMSGVFISNCNTNYVLKLFYISVTVFLVFLALIHDIK